MPVTTGRERAYNSRRGGACGEREKIRATNMKNTVTGVVLSGLVFPGLGQIALKSYRRGVWLIVAVAVALITMITIAVKQARTIFHQLETDGGTIDMAAITDAVDRFANTTDSMVINGAFLLLIVLWLFGIIDAFRIGRKRDAVARASTLHQ